jgi:hypothetical protein
LPPAASNLVVGRAPTKLTHRELGEIIAAARRPARKSHPTPPCWLTAQLQSGKNSTTSELNHLSKPVGTRLPIKLYGACHGILTEQPSNVFALVKREVMAEVSLAAAKICASQYFGTRNNYSLSGARLLRMMRRRIKS